MLLLTLFCLPCEISSRNRLGPSTIYFICNQLPQNGLVMARNTLTIFNLRVAKMMQRCLTVVES